jgi:hypothetical protein
MANPEMRFDSEARAFLVGDRIRIDVPHDREVVAPVEAVAGVSVASFERALSQYEEIVEGGDISVFLSDVPLAQFDPDRPLRKVWLSFAWGHSTVEVSYSLDNGQSDTKVDGLLAPLLDRHAAESRGSWRDEQAGYWSEFYSLALEDSTRTMGELAKLALEAQALLDAASGTGELTAATCRDLLAGGHAGALCGQPESSWIDAKVEPHRIDTDRAVLEFAKDVAAFANTGEDALIVYGIRTSASRSGDVLDELRPIKLSSFDMMALRNALRDRLVPLVPDIEVSAVERGGGFGFGWIFIPAQPEYARPLLVRGAVADGTVIGTHVSVPFRIGEDTGYWDASMIHSLIQAGRVALQGALGPPSSARE